MGVNKVIYDGNVLIDLSGDTLVSPEQLAKDVIAHSANGDVIVGTFDVSEDSVFAAIGVTYPEGSTLTCTNGTKTLTARTSTGQWVFAVPEPGTWTVTVTDGTSSKSQSVEITAEGQLESVTLSYELVLFDGTNGGDNNAETGGWTKSNLNTFTVGTNSIYAMYSESGESMAETSYYFRTKNKIDLTNYSTLTFVLSDVSKEGLSPKLGVSTATNMETKAASTTVANGTRAINISSLTGSYYIGLEETHTIYGEYSFEVNITKVVLS